MQLQWNAGMQLAADKIVTGPGRSSRVYFESRRSRHENRFDKPGVVGVATWQYKRFVGLRAANASDGPAVLLTKHTAEGIAVKPLYMSSSSSLCTIASNMLSSPAGGAAGREAAVGSRAAVRAAAARAAATPNFEVAAGAGLVVGGGR